MKKHIFLFWLLFSVVGSKHWGYLQNGWWKQVWESTPAQVSPLYLWTQAQQPISDLQRVSSYPCPLTGLCDRWPSACRYCTIFQFPAQEEEFKGLSEVQKHSVVPPVRNQPPASCWRPKIQTFSWEHSRNQVLSVSTKQPLPPSSCLTDSSAEDTDRRPNSLYEGNITKKLFYSKTYGVRPRFAWCWAVVLHSDRLPGPLNFLIQSIFWRAGNWGYQIFFTKYFACMGHQLKLLFGPPNNLIKSLLNYWSTRQEFVFLEHEGSFLTLKKNRSLILKKSTSGPLTSFC